MSDASTARHMWQIEVYSRTPSVISSSGTKYRYTPLDTHRYHRGVTPPGMLLLNPPRVGDLITLGGGSTYRVELRDFIFTQYGSAGWPPDHPLPIHPGICRLIVRKTDDGPFADEDTEVPVFYRPPVTNRMLVDHETGDVEFQIEGEEGDWVTTRTGRLDSQDNRVIVFDDDKP